MSWILFKQICAFLHFAPCVYAKLWIGPYKKELTDDPDVPKALEDYLDTQEIQEDIPDD